MTALHKEKFEREKLKILSEKESGSKECGVGEDEGSLEGASSDKESEHTKESEKTKKEKKRKQRKAIKKIREKMKRDVEMSQIAKETRCGIHFTGKDN